MSEPIGKSVVKLLVSPIQFYQDRTATRWFSPVTALACYCSMLALAGAISSARLLGEFRSDVILLTSGLAIVAFAFLFALQTGAVVCIERLFSSARNGRYLAKCSAMAYWTQVPIAAAGIWFWAVIAESGAPVLTASAGIVTIAEELFNAADTHTTTPEADLFHLIASYWSLWVVALQAAALRAVSKFSVGGAWAAGLFLGISFVALPWSM